MVRVHTLAEPDGDHAFHDVLRAEIGRSQRHLRPLSLLMIDLNHLKMYNDTSGHPAGEVILQEVAWLLKKSVRNCDVVARYGRDEFAIILAEANKADAMNVADRLGRLLGRPGAVHGGALGHENRIIGATIGVASYPTDACQQMELVTKADQAVREAKALGGNLVRAAEQELVPMRTYHDKRLYFLCKRCMDVILSLLFLVITFPLFLLIALLIRLDSAGPALFKQRRVGVRKRSVGAEKRWELSMFAMYKFRTMHSKLDDRFHRTYMRSFVKNQVDAAGDGKTYKPVQSSQITRVGRFLRKTSLDELPQILNVLKGEMTLVGPRPNVPWEVERYEPWHYKRFETLPGITGLAQVRGRSCLSFDRIVEYDIEYIEEQSLLTDLRILWWTVLFVIFGQGAY